MRKYMYFWVGVEGMLIIIIRVKQLLLAKFDMLMNLNMYMFLQFHKTMNIHREGTINSYFDYNGNIY